MIDYTTTHVCFQERLVDVLEITFAVDFSTLILFLGLIYDICDLTYHVVRYSSPHSVFLLLQYCVSVYILHISCETN